MATQCLSDLTVYVGTYTTAKQSRGIYIYRMDLSVGELALSSVVEGVVDPSFLVTDPEQRYLYAANEVLPTNGEPPGGFVSAFAIDQNTGELAALNRRPSHGTLPCHVSVEASGQFLLLTNYGSGSVVVYPIRDGGELGEATDVVQHEGSSIDPRRQKGPHAHSVTLDPANRFAFVADLGLDQVKSYELNLVSGKLVPNAVPWNQVKAGSGPRHFTFHPNGRYAYLINELNATLMAFAYDPTRGALTELQTVPALPEGYTGRNWCADVHVAPSGRFLYGSNRVHDSIVIYQIDQDTGKLTLVGHELTQGETPRNFSIDPTGKYLLAANKDSDTIVVFRIEPDTGKLRPTGHVVEVPAPVCVLMVSFSS